VPDLGYLVGAQPRVKVPRSEARSRRTKGWLTSDP